LRVNESVDLTDALGSNIYVHFKESNVVRITPKSNTEINTNIISDKARFSFDSHKLNRISFLYRREEKNLVESD